MKPKNRSLVFLFFSFSIALCHAQNSTVFKDDMDAMFQVNRSYVTTGLLKDYGLLLTDVSKFNGTLQTNNMADRGVWQVLYSSLYFMKFNANASLLTPAVINTTLAGYASTVNGHKVNNIIALHYNYEQFKTNAATSNLVYVVNNKIYDKPNRPTTPYEVKTAFCMVPQESILSGATQVFRFRSELLFKNVNKTIGTVQIDFGDGAGYRNIAIGADNIITYTTEGLKTLQFKIIYTDGTALQSKSQVIVSNILTADNTCTICRYRDNDGNLNADPPVPLPVSNFAYPATSDMGVGEAFVYYGGTDRILDKPLIIVEGFDPNNARSHEAMFSEDFLGKRMIIDGTDQELYKFLDGNGFDIVFLNLTDGGGDIKRNGRLLENLVQWVNQQKALNGSTEKNIVIGVSMGGIIARYGLRDMELHGIPHDTKLYGSFDSPHLGANIPLGIQAAIRVLAGASINGIALKDYLDMSEAINSLDCPAAKQMLFYQWQGLGKDITVDNTPHDAFYAELNGMGLPQMGGIRKIAIASGSECGASQGFNPYSTLINIDKTKDLDYGINLLVGLVLQKNIAQQLGSFLSGLVTTESDILLSGYVKSLPDKQVKTVFTFTLEYKKVILWGLASNTKTLFTSSKSSMADMLPLDNNAGGSYDLNDLIDKLPSNTGVTPVQFKFGFIPTASALYMGSGAQILTTPDLTNPYSRVFPPTGAKTIPFDNFFSNPLSNEKHVQVTEKNGRWLFKEFQDEPEIFSCSYQCANTSVSPSIIGPDPVCFGGNRTYTTSSLTPGSTLAWSNSSNLSYVAGQGTNSYVLQSTNSATSSAGFVRVTIGGECQSRVFEKQVWVGKPFIDGTYNNGELLGFTPYPSDEEFIYQNPVCNGNYTSTNMQLGGSVSGYWQRVWASPTNTTWTQTGNNISFYFWAVNQTATFRLTTSNSCGSAINDYAFKSIDCSGGGGDPCDQYSVSPNPSSSTINIIVPNIPAPCDPVILSGSEVEQTESALTIQSISLTDANGQLKHSRKFSANTKQAELDVSVLQRGVYILKISDGTYTETHRIIKN